MSANEPAAHGAHTLEPEAAAMVPGAHAVQAAAPALEMVPAAHSAQLAAPVKSLNVPAAHAAHAVEPSVSA